MEGESLDIKYIQLQKLKSLFPEVVSEEKVDWERLKATLGEDVAFSNERYVLNWAGKSDAFRALQAPTTATLIPDRDESVRFDETGHVFIEGENLEVLKVLQKSYYGKVKMIYIDPPYNTGNDHFIYPDRFSESKKDYLTRVGDKDEEGYLTREGLYRKNSRDNGHYHSNWLNMMYPRLFLARNLLKDDGVIFVSIDDNEVHNLRLLMNEIFGEENLVAHVIWQKKYSPQNDAKYFSESHEHVICYSKIRDTFEIGLLPRSEKADSRYKNPDNDPRGPWKPSDLTRQEYRQRDDYEIISPISGKKFKPPKGNSWGRPRSVVENLIQDNRIWFGPDGNSVPQLKRFLTEVKQGITPQTIWLREEVGDSQEGKKEIKKIFGDVSIFETPKPTRLIRRAMLTANLKDGDLVFDFFAGSGSLADAVFKSNILEEKKLKFLLVQLPEKISERASHQEEGYHTIADIAKERIRRVIKKIEDERDAEQKKKSGELNFGEEKDVSQLDLGFKVFKLRPSNFKIWRGGSFENGEQLARQLETFTDPVKEGSEEQNMFYELLLKSGFDLNSRVEHRGAFYVVNGGELAVALSEMSEAVVEEIIALEPQKCIALDKLFAGNDQLKTNTVLQMRDAGVEFKTI